MLRGVFMNKVIKNADAQLETFFKKIKLEKSAAIGHFGDVHSEEDMERVGKMVYEMVQLPKYDVIRKELQGSSGVVNFVTGNEYEPLVEFLVKTTFPPSSNDVYHMGHGSTLPEDYFVDASEYFGPSQGSKADAIESRRKLEFLLRGTPKKMTLKWLEDHNLDGQTLNQYFAQSDDEILAADGQSPGEALVSAIKDFSDNWEALQNGKLRRDIDILFKKLEKQREVKAANKKIADENSGKLPQDQKSFYPVLTEDKIKMLTEELRYKRGIWTNRRQQLLNGYPAINIVDQFSGKTERNNDGFLQWNPVEEIREVYSALVHSDGETPEIDNLIEILKTNIKDYRTTDKDLIKKKKQILDFFEKSDQEQVIKWMNHLGTFNRLMNSFIEGAMRHGKVILLSNIDSSALVTQPKEVGEGAYMQDGGLFNDFDAANSSNLLRDRSEGRTTRGKRTIVLVTSSPLQNLQAASKVEMDLSPVDEEEAEIIVRHSCAPYAMEARRAVELKMLANIEEKYGNTVTTEELNKRDRELASIGQTLTKLQDQLGYITPESIKKMEQMLIGMGQRDAIKVCRQSLESHVEREYNEDGIITGLKIDEEGALGTMVNSMTKAKTTDTLGLEIQKPKVKFDNYITNKMSTWGDIVGDVGFKKNELAHTNKMIAEIRGEISQIDFDLQGNIDKKTRNQLLKSRDGWKAELDMAVAGKHGFMKDFPHFTILYGKPGTGKSVWGDALADLCDLMFYRVDIGKIKDKWVGNTGKFADKMISSIFASRNAVFLMDEVDRMMEMEHGSQGGGTGTAHEVTKDIVQKFLFAFGERMPELIERNIFVIMTTNNIEGIDTALLERSKGDVYEVEAADRPEDFLQFLSTFLETERADNPKDPWIKYGGTTDEEMWDYTIKFVSENIDLNALATVFAERRLSYRNLSGMLRQACRHHNTYLDSIGAISRGDNIDIHGLPMTTENLIKAAKLAKDASNSNADYDFGINTVKVDTVTQVRQMMENMELVPESTQHPVTGEKNTTYSLPKEVQKILNGELETEDISPQYEVVEEVGPDGKTRSLVQSPPQGKTMQELTDSGMQEKSIGLEQEKTVPIEEDEDQDKKKALGSSTDYLFNFLQKEGVVSEKGKLVDAQEREHQQETARNMPYDSVENNGVFYYNNGQIFMAPRIV